MKLKQAVLNDIYAELISAYENLKAEVLIAEIQENSDITADDFVIANKSTFSRPYRRDIIDVDTLINEDRLTLYLSRNSLYDTLPEGLFHASKGTQGSSSYLTQRKVAKEEEEDARSFFSPFENEFFYQSLRIERSERELLDNFYRLNNDFLVDFWKIDQGMPEKYILKLVKLLPYSHKISGDLELTRMCLEKVLDENVFFKKKFENTMTSQSNDKNKVQQTELQLGVNSVLNGSENAILSPVLEVTIGPISEKKINNYLKKDGILKFINTFYDYFIPMELDVFTKFTLINENGFLLDNANSPIMGISTKL
jgi:hypothetical protein